MSDDTMRPMDTAPKDGTAFLAEIPGHGSENIISWQRWFLDYNFKVCGCWCFDEGQDEPDSWTDGSCWDENDAGEPSVQPTGWKPLDAARAAGLDKDNPDE